MTQNVLHVFDDLHNPCSPLINLFTDRPNGKKVCARGFSNMKDQSGSALLIINVYDIPVTTLANISEVSG